MLIKIFAGISAVATALITILNFMGQQWYNLIWIVIAVFIGCYLACNVLYALFMLIVLAICTDMNKPQEKPSAFFNWNLLEISRTLCTYARVKVKVNGAELIPKDKRFLLVCNHRTLADPVVDYVGLGDYDIAYISKAANFKIPLVGNLMYKCCSLPLVREDNREGLKTINKAAEYIKNDICSIGIYPEGTRNKTDDPLLPFHAGSFKIAQKSGAPVVVLLAQGMNEIKKNTPWRTTNVTLDICGVIDGETVKSQPTKLTAETAKTMMEAKLSASEHSKEPCTK